MEKKEFNIIKSKNTGKLYKCIVVNYVNVRIQDKHYMTPVYYGYHPYSNEHRVIIAGYMFDKNWQYIICDNPECGNETFHNTEDGVRCTKCGGLTITNKK